ncbi:hypothetical protein HEK616_17170 [Streptomyces nigrescens]|uniref:UDP-N-acetylmuramyl pentapeptide phosphotransferase/UDP-N-acetylglucosamine-1-phosphate transferase n=2 Tax=Streptomyces TaxID=1883 RepID=A0ABN6QQK3_STRNI|nr:hypothetical protein [Streptomyces nigrescens]MEE4425067.1 hypothetical protein [Streptomyces sp. DSM 41528]BDM68230.1 hypothetical protein HEK616_17170 [Streptomyces nigrescens]
MVAVAGGKAFTRISALLAAAGATRVAYGALRSRPPGGAVLWERKNHAGRTVHLHAGLATAAGTALAAATAPGLPARTRAAAALAVLAAGACGAYDDVFGAGDPRRGFRAHLAALRNREVTSGAVKLFGIGAAGLAAGALVKERPADKLLAGVVIAGSAHVVNLLDVRPGRAAGAVLALGAPGLLRRGPAGPLSAAPMGAAAAVARDDLEERTMLGDAGAHALGAALGLAVATGTTRPALTAHAAALVAATIAGERVSRSGA